jgi:SAM-dependent methyltransferase
MRKPNKYLFYERAVQSPEEHAEFFTRFYKELRGSAPRVLREDFCGTFRISCEWVRTNPKHKALAIDLDPEPLAEGLGRLSGLKPGERERLKVVQGNALDVTKPGVDLVAACNFSFNIFYRRAELLRYFSSARASLSPKGLLVLEMAGGPGMLERTREQRSYKADASTPAFTYFWDQRSFNPITRRARYSIHFNLKSGEKLRDAFTYDWRLWTVPEIRDALIDAGFKDTHVYWETSHRGEGTGEYVKTEDGDNAYAWIAYVIGCR